MFYINYSMLFVFLSIVWYRKVVVCINVWCIWECMEEWNFYYNMLIIENRNCEINWFVCLVKCVFLVYKIKKKSCNEKFWWGR